MQMRRMAFINLALEVKRIVEVEAQREDFTFLLEAPDNETDIVLEKDYQPGVNNKLPVIVVDIDEVSTEPLEMGGVVWDVCDISIDVQCVNKPESMDMAEIILKHLVGEHDFYNFNRDEDVPDMNVAFDPATLPTSKISTWSAIEDDFTQANLKLINTSDPNYVKRYSSMLEGRIRYIRDFAKN